MIRVYKIYPNLQKIYNQVFLLNKISDQKF